ncbi:MAG: DinB family protein [Acidobacteriota bacterium]
MPEAPVRTALSRGPGASFPELSARYLEEYLEKIRHVTALLDEDQIWWRPVPDTNSIGNLLLHLAGNLTMWIAKGVGGDAFERHRSAEFAADRSHTRDEMIERLAAVVDRCRQVLDSLEGEPLDRVVEVQGYRLDVLGIILHAVEHMSYHTGQILSLAKQARGEGHGIELYPQHQGE